MADTMNRNARYSKSVSVHGRYTIVTANHRNRIDGKVGRSNSAAAEKYKQKWREANRVVRETRD